MQKVIRRIGLSTLSMLLVFGAWAQVTYSPYSILGVGELNSMDLVHNRAMGGLGISSGDAFFLNNKNPALLTYNRVVVFEAGLSTEQKSLRTSELSQKNFTGGLSHLAFGFPAIKDKWTISFGLMPFSTVNYQSTSLGIVQGGSSQLLTSFDGSGGISQAYFATGFKATESLSLGLRSSYIFGTIRRETSFLIENTNFQTVNLERNSFSDFAWSLGAAYNIEIKENEDYLNFGIIYDFGGDRKVTRLERLERRDLGGDLLSPADTLPYLITDNVKGTVKFPSTLGLGVSYDKRFKWSVGLDVVLAPWSEYENFDGEVTGLNDMTNVALGGSWTPDLFSASNYLKRITYRLGFNYQQTPYKVNNTDITDFGINFGVTLPLRNLSRLNLAFKVGQRGTTDDNLIRETYFKAYLGLTVNDNKWFIRRKFD